MDILLAAMCAGAIGREEIFHEAAGGVASKKIDVMEIDDRESAYSFEETLERLTRAIAQAGSASNGRRCDIGCGWS